VSHPLSLVVAARASLASLTLLVACSTGEAPRASAPTGGGGAVAGGGAGGAGRPSGRGGAGGATGSTSTSGSTSGDAGAGSGVELLAVVDLPRKSATTALSGTVYDAETRTLFALQDTAPRLVPLVASEDLRSFTVGAPILLTGRPGDTWDGEAVVRLGKDFVAVTDETLALVERFDAAGAYLGAVAVPPVYTKQAANNKGLESLALAPSGAFLFTVNESALVPDGPAATKAKGTLVRLLRREVATGAEAQHAYRTEPLGAGTGGDMGVSDLAAVSDHEVLVLERGWQSGFGNTVRIFRVDVTAAGPGSADVSAVAALDAATPTLPKKLVVDLGALPPSGATNPGQQPNPLLDNYEALSLGPSLPDGRRVVFVTSDDNALPTQVARVLVLAVPGI
jgi:hypothetical protein